MQSFYYTYCMHTIPVFTFCISPSRGVTSTIYNGILVRQTDWYRVLVPFDGHLQTKQSDIVVGSSRIVVLMINHLGNPIHDLKTLKYALIVLCKDHRVRVWVHVTVAEREMIRNVCIHLSY